MGTISGYYSTVQKILARVTSNTLREFEELSTDEERFEYVISLEYVGDAFNVKPSFECKSVQESKRLREQGNVYFQKKDYKEALSLYNRAVLYAPMVQSMQNGQSHDNGEVVGLDEFVLALGNRSATLFKLRECKRCLDDISVALKYGYPRRLLYKLYDRQGRCYQELGQPEKAVESFKNIFGVISEANIDEHKKDHVIKSVKRQVALIEGTPIGEDLCISDNSSSSTSTAELRSMGILGDDDNLSPPALAIPEGRIYPGTSESFQVKYSPEKGRYAVTSNDLQSGDVIIVESPYVSVIDSTQYNLRCYHCSKKIKVPMGCQQCMKIMYCGEACREESWESYHSMECAFLSPLLSSGTGSIGHLALRVVMTAGYSKIIKCKKNPFSDKRNANQSLFTSKGVYMGGYMGLYNLVTHTEQRSRNDLFQYTILAIYLLTILEQVDFFPDDNSHDPRTRTCIGGILLRFLQIIACNGIEITEMSVGSALQRTDPESIGLALFPTVSLLNHSCDPSLELIFYDNTCAVRAIQNVQAGQEICIDYGYLYYVTPKKQRQLSLRAQYFFDCRCIACSRDWMLKSNLKSDIPVLKCSQCVSPLLSLFSINENPLAEEQDPNQHQCRKCGHVENPMELYEKLQKSGVLFERAVDQARRWEMKRALPMLQHHLKLLDKHVSLPWKDYVTCVSTIKQCYRMEGNRNKNPPMLL